MNYYLRRECQSCHSFIDLFALFELGFLLDLALPVDVLLVEAFHHILGHVFAAFLPEVWTECALLAGFVLLLLTA